MIFWFSDVLFLWEFDKMIEAYYMVYFPTFCIIQTGIQDGCNTLKLHDVPHASYDHNCCIAKTHHTLHQDWHLFIGVTWIDFRMMRPDAFFFWYFERKLPHIHRPTSVLSMADQLTPPKGIPLITKDLTREMKGNQWLTSHKICFTSDGSLTMVFS